MGVNQAHVDLRCTQGKGKWGVAGLRDTILLVAGVAEGKWFDSG